MTEMHMLLRGENSKSYRNWKGQPHE